MPRPSLYKPEYNIQTERLCRLGATDEELATFFEVAVSTISLWKTEHPEFSEAIKRGKIESDAEVADKLYSRATGYEWDEQVPMKVKEVTYENGKRLREIEHIEVTSVHKVVPPDTTAAIFWLKNRRKTEWRDRHELTGKDGDAIETITTLTYMPKQLPDDYYLRNQTNNTGQ